MQQRGQEHPGAMQPDAAPVPREEVGTVGVLGEVLIFAFACKPKWHFAAHLLFTNLYFAYQFLLHFLFLSARLG